MTRRNPLLARAAQSAAARAEAAFMAGRLSEREHTALSLGLLSSLDTIARGQHPGKDEWQDMADVVNVLVTLKAQGRIEVDGAEIERVEQAMVEAAGRYKAGRPLRMDGAGLVALQGLVHAWLELARTMTRAQLQRVRDDTDARVRAAVRSGKATVADVEREVRT